jgi:hypothetical protein
VTFEEFKKAYLKYEYRYDTLLYERIGGGEINGYLLPVELKYKVYDKYSLVPPCINLSSKEANVVARLMNVEDEKYLKRVYDWLYPSKNIYGLHDD